MLLFLFHPNPPPPKDRLSFLYGGVGCWENFLNLKMELSYVHALSLCDLGRATLASLHLKLSNASVVGPKVKKKKMKLCLMDHVYVLGNSFYYFMQQPNTMYFPVKFSNKKRSHRWNLT